MIAEKGQPCLFLISLMGTSVSVAHLQHCIALDPWFLLFLMLKQCM